MTLTLVLSFDLHVGFITLAPSAKEELGTLKTCGDRWWTVESRKANRLNLSKSRQWRHAWLTTYFFTRYTEYSRPESFFSHQHTCLSKPKYTSVNIIGQKLAYPNSISCVALLTLKGSSHNFCPKIERGWWGTAAILEKRSVHWLVKTGPRHARLDVAISCAPGHQVDHYHLGVGWIWRRNVGCWDSGRLSCLPMFPRQMNTWKAQDGRLK